MLINKKKGSNKNRRNVNPDYWRQRIVGGNSEGETPFTIPNKEVKSFSADGTAF